MMFVYHYVIILFHPQYLPRHAPQGGGIQGGGIGVPKLSTFLYCHSNLKDCFVVFHPHYDCLSICLTMNDELKSIQQRLHIHARFVAKVTSIKNL